MLRPALGAHAHDAVVAVQREALDCRARDALCRDEGAGMARRRRELRAVGARAEHLDAAEEVERLRVLPVVHQHAVGPAEDGVLDAGIVVGHARVWMIRSVSGGMMDSAVSR